jgi:hypothetical protein
LRSNIAKFQETSPDEAEMSARLGRLTDATPPEQNRLLSNLLKFIEKRPLRRAA